MAIITDGQMHSPSHPGEILKAIYMEPLKISVTKLADALDVSRKHVSAVIHGRASVSTDLAVRLGIVFDTSPKLWMNLQTQHDLWRASLQAKPKVKRLAA